MKKLNLKFTFAVLAVLLLTASCGKKDENQGAPAPAPAAPAPAPAAPPPPPTIQGTNCPVVQGSMPLSQNGSLFYGNLMGQQNAYNSSSSMTLNVQLTNYTGFNTPGQNVVASGSMYLPDLATLNRYPIANQNFNICVSTNSVSNGAPSIPGTYRVQDGSVQMVLQGNMQVPTMPTYYGSPYPQTGTPTYTSDTLQVFVGYDCPAYLSPAGRVYGCVTVQIGNPSYGGPVLKYQSR